MGDPDAKDRAEVCYRRAATYRGAERWWYRKTDRRHHNSLSRHVPRVPANTNRKSQYTYKQQSQPWILSHRTLNMCSVQN
jgi:hypothetical protein